MGDHQIETAKQTTLGSTRVTQKFEPHVGSSSTTGEESGLEVEGLGFCDESEGCLVDVVGLVLIASDMRVGSTTY